MQDLNDLGTIDMFEKKPKAVVLQENRKEDPEEVKLEVLSYPNPYLRHIVRPYTSKEVVSCKDTLNEIASFLTLKMYEHRGIGLAANQCGQAERMFVMDVDYPLTGKKNPRVFLNPEILEIGNETAKLEEGCLSVPFEFNGLITRPALIALSYLDLDGNQETTMMSGISAACAQHETDHLDGILFIDYLSRIRRRIIDKKIDKYLRLYIKGHQEGVRRASTYHGKRKRGNKK
jgi:peptide deformylase